MYSAVIDEFDLLGPDEEPDPLTDRITDQHARLALHFEDLPRLGPIGAIELRIRLASHLRAEREVVYERVAGLPEIEYELPAHLDGHRAIEAHRGSWREGVGLCRNQFQAETDQLLPLVREALGERERGALADLYEERRLALVEAGLMAERRDVLRALARAHEVPGRGRMTKPALAKALTAY